MTSTASLAVAVSAVVGLGGLTTASFGVLEYRRRGRQSVAEMFFKLRERLKTPALMETAELVDLWHGEATSDQSVANRLTALPLSQKQLYLAFFEELHFAQKTRLLAEDDVHYMFGNYAILVAECPPFWVGLDMESPLLV